MTPETVSEKVEKIRRDGDPETAHVAEDTLWREVLQAIAEGHCTDPRECARLAASTTTIEFERWYA